jgi:soluble lytic murein transglycosylase
VTVRSQGTAPYGRRLAAGALSLFGVVILGGTIHAQLPAARPVPAALSANPRPAPPADPADLWLLPVPANKPGATPASIASFAAGAKAMADARYADAITALRHPDLEGTPLAGYAKYFTGLAYLNTSRAAEARAAFAQLRATEIAGYLSEAAALREAEAATLQGDHAAAAAIYDSLSRTKNGSPEEILLARARAYRSAGNGEQAAEGYRRLFYEFPASDLSATAATELGAVRDTQTIRDTPGRYKLELGRAERLFGSRRYAPAREAFELLRPLATGDDSELVVLRIAECDHYLRRYQAARDALAPYLDGAARKAEARFFHLTATRELGEHEEYVRLAQQLAADFPETSWAEDALNNLGTHHILLDEDEAAATVFRQLYDKYPRGRHAERAAWKAGWWAYKRASYHDTISLFENATGAFPRSDYRPAYLYWAARARERTGDEQGAATVYGVIVSDYLRSYYGRLAEHRLEDLGVRAQAAAAAAVQQAANVTEAAVPTPPPVPTAELIRLLLSLELYDLARNEVAYAQRLWGESPQLNATLAYACYKQGDLRRGIIYMKRAYPQFMAANASSLPADLLKVIYPVNYWPQIRRYAAQRNLDPHLVAALINQESSFIPDAKSSANAIGLMQILPSTGRRYARTLRVRRFTAASLTKPELNLQLGTAYFSDLSRRLGGVHLALASYNAGESRVATWTSERPGIERDEFIDDIPFPETQNYVKRILGSAEDYRRLYGDQPPPKPTTTSAPKAGAKTGKTSPVSKKQ